MRLHVMMGHDCMHARMQAAERPATSLMTLLLAGVYLLINNRGVGYAEVGVRIVDNLRSGTLRLQLHQNTCLPASPSSIRDPVSVVPVELR